MRPSSGSSNSGSANSGSANSGATVSRSIRSSSGPSENSSPGRSFRYQPSNSGQSNSASQVQSVQRAQNNAAQFSRGQDSSGRNTQRNAVIVDQPSNNSNNSNSSADAFRRARGNATSFGNSSDSGANNANNSNSNPAVVRSGRGFSNQSDNNRSNQAVTGGDSSRRTIDKSSRNANDGNNITRGSRRGAPTTKQVSEFLNIPDDNGQSQANTPGGQRRNLVNQPGSDNDNGQRFTRGRRSGGGNDNQPGSDNKTGAIAGGGANADKGATGDNLQLGRRRGQDNVGTGKNVINDPTNTAGNDNDNGNRGRGGRRGNDGRDNDGSSGRWNIGRGRGGDGDHRDWSGKWNNSDRLNVANKVRNDWNHKGRRHDDDFPFHGGWWKNHHRSHHHHWDWFVNFHHDPFYWWHWAYAPRLSTWFTFGWPTPYYWDYGPGEYIHCLDGVVYVNGRWFQPAPLYYQQTVLLVDSAPTFTPQQAVEVQWMPLGVFAVTQDGVANANLLVQLAVTPDGVLGGTVLNQQTGVSFEAKGTVDKTSQRAVWSYVDQTGTRIVMESSVFNLTQPQATGLIHYSPNNIQVIELVRLEDPAADGAVGADAVLGEQIK